MVLHRMNSHRMASKRWLNTLVLITLIHVGVIFALIRQGYIEPPRWVATQLVSSEAPPETRQSENDSRGASVSQLSEPQSKQAQNNAVDGLKYHPSVESERSAEVAKNPTITSPINPTINPTEQTQGDTTASALSSTNQRSGVNSATNSATHSATNSANTVLTLPTHIGGYLHNPQPPYPAFSQDNGEQGVVTLSVMVEPDGRASSVDVVKGSGYARLDRSAYETVLHQYRFTPATRGGQPIAYRYRFNIRFN